VRLATVDPPFPLPVLASLLRPLLAEFDRMTMSRDDNRKGYVSYRGDCMALSVAAEAVVSDEVGLTHRDEPLLCPSGKSEPDLREVPARVLRCGLSGHSWAMARGHGRHHFTSHGPCGLSSFDVDLMSLPNKHSAVARDVPELTKSN